MLRGMSSHIRLGRRGERLARRYYEALECEFVAADYRCPGGELDLVMRDGVSLIFVEVKTRRREGEYRPLDNLSQRQLKRNIRASRQFIRNYGLGRYLVRYEVVEIVCTPWRLRSLRRHCLYAV